MCIKWGAFISEVFNKWGTESVNLNHCDLQDLFNFLNKAKNEGYIKKEIKIPFLLFMLDRTTEFFNDPELISIMPDTKERGYELASLFLYAFSNSMNE